jgi:hypothetical protein
VVIGRRWLEAADSGAPPRLFAPADPVRKEIEIALENQIEIIPVLVDGAAMPARTELPGEIAELTAFNAFEISIRRFHPDAEQLVQHIRSRRKFGLLTALPWSFFSAQLYRDVARHWSGGQHLYLILLLSLSWLPMMPGFQTEVQEFVRQAMPVAAQLPYLEVKDGRLSTDADEPYTIWLSDGSLPLLTIDTAGQYSSPYEAGAFILLTETQMISMEEGGQRIDRYDKYFDFWIDRGRAENLLGMINDWLVIAAYPAIVATTFLLRLLEAYALALLGIVVSRAMNVTISYKALLRLAIVAFTPAIVLDTARQLLAVALPWAHVLGLGITACYLCFAIRANARPSQVVADFGRE